MHELPEQRSIELSSGVRDGRTPHSCPCSLPLSPSCFIGTLRRRRCVHRLNWEVILIQPERVGPPQPTATRASGLSDLLL